ncbi:hypothetical protein FD00_GL001238 [Liquorilactobacillus mali KCTC 3596 = DSM 20444]|uniref:Uncharacterized protein n=1 Tax=Liquorilactobacillus mali KCTC 3596 = DSM 20444 TaxID=1046596 RepID=A0A0R2EG92_9LACO|nr:hypothetical protein FD00_GL001238 [Liquorilactobacillus mali KCTC 3596 = DSM 20444]
MVKKLISGKASTSLLNFFVERLHTRVLISGTTLINVYFPLISVFVIVSPCVLFNSNSGKRLAILIGSPLVDVGFSCLVIFNFTHSFRNSIISIVCYRLTDKQIFVLIKFTFVQKIIADYLVLQNCCIYT